ncbi:MAG: hypothetical protein A4E56_00151 [Pelotomaculum sp. PtaU1.Bin065]|nr:MAG: hypothetical protein A4E56_00151 [Pelotomaculum sp. PtaU1.Bin065]
MATLKLFDSLPPCYEYKRRMASSVFKVISPAQGTFADASLSGGALCLYAKALGYRVETADDSPAGYIMGKALIENNRAKINDIDIKRLLTGQPKRSFITENFVPEAFTAKHAEFLERAFDRAIADIGASPKQWLLLYLLIRFVYKVRPFMKYASHVTTIPVEDWRVEYTQSRGFYSALKTVLRPVDEILNELAGQINRGIIDNAKENQVGRDAPLDFLLRTEADAVYMEPYSKRESFHMLDEILKGHRFKERKEDDSEDPQRAAKMFEAAEHIPVWVVGVRNPDHADNLAEIMKGCRKVERYRISHMSKGEQKGQSYLLVGRA